MGKAMMMLDSQTKMKTSKCHQDGSADKMMRKNGYERLMVQLAGTYIGQAILMQFEKMLWSLEKTALWISNNKTVGRKGGKAPASLVRPLPWIVFLPTLIVLRYVRIVLSLAAICLGFDEIEASTMVAYLHDVRCYIYTIRRGDGQSQYIPQKDEENYHRSFYPDIIGKALVNGISSVCAWPISDIAKVQNNKTLLDLNSDDVLENGSNASDDHCCTTDSEDHQQYKDLLNRSFPIQSDESDEDYICKNGSSSADTSESSHMENSFFEEGEIEALKEDVNRYNGREIVLEINEPKINGNNKNHESSFLNETEPAITLSPNEPSQDATDHQPSSSSSTNVTTNSSSHNKNNGKKIHKSKGKHIKKNKII